MKKGILIHFGELSTKGKNRENFIEALAKNINHALKGLSCEVKRDHDHIRVYMDEVPEEALSRLLEVSGINRLSLFYECGKDMDAIRETALLAYREDGGKTFKVETSRSDKSFPLDSYAISRDVGGYILRNVKESSVDVHEPETRVRILVTRPCAYVYAKTIRAAGGYPLGTLGKVLMLISGGIDSPVASYALLKRGIAIEGIHFAAPPYTSEEAINKVKDLLGVLTRYQRKIKLHVVNFTKLQLAIYKEAGDPYAITIMRRMMLRIAERLAKEKGCLALASGESVGQVASQTLQSMVAINAVTSYPIIRPLATFDKNETIDIAKKIGTYDISIRPYEDCCTIFTPRHPVTRPKIDICEDIEKKIDFEAMVEECVQTAETILIGGEEE